MKHFRFLAMLLFAASLAFTACGSDPDGGSDVVDKAPAVINIAAIPGVVVPVRGETPVTTEINTDQYTGTITWSPEDNYFRASTVYTANIELTAKAGWTLSGVTENFFTVAGAVKVTNAADSGFIKAEFTETGVAPDIDVTFFGVKQIDGISNSVTTKALELTFDVDPTSLTVDNITIIGATKDKLSGTGTTRTLEISNITVANGEKVYVTITNPNGYSITGSPKTAVVYRISFVALKYVPGGSFQRNGNAANISTVKAFRMSEKEITRAQFKSVTGIDPSDTTRSTGTDDPVQNVSWYHAMVFCNKLSMQEGLDPVYSIDNKIDPASWGEVPTSSNGVWNAAIANRSANGYRLPTEMEWMWAAMGADKGNPGKVNTTGYIKAFAGSTGSNNIDSYVWYSSNSNNTTHPVGTKAANELGLYDMSGNVWEWCWDWYELYPDGVLTDFWGAATGTYRVIRGGYWNYGASYATVASRNRYNPYYVYFSVGFRVVRP